MSNLLIQGTAFLLGDEVNTDINCSSKYLPGKDSQFVSTVAFDKLRSGFANMVLESGKGIIVAGENFGINSSREQAIEILRLMGVQCIIAPSFGRQFFRNAINNGLPIIECDTAHIQENDQLSVDLEQGSVEIKGGLSKKVHPLPREILKIIEMGGLLNFISQHPDWNFNA